MVAVSPGRSASEKRLAIPRHFDWWLLLSAGILLMAGLLSLYSIDYSWGTDFFKRQLLRVGVGLVPFLILYLVNPKLWQRYWPYLYAFNLGLLVLVLVAGRSGGGAQRWINIGPLDFQPSELAKLLIVITLASFFSAYKDEARRLPVFLLSFVHVAIPMGLIFLQPHLGATLVVAVAWLGISVAAGVRGRYVIATIVLLIAAVAGAYFVPGVLKPYQRERVEALLNPNYKENAFQAMRAEIAIGSGSIFGTGYLKGEQKAGRFIPEQETDFIFTVPGEELGLIGSTLLLIAYGLFFFRLWIVMFNAQDAYFRMLVAGVFCYMGFHTVANLGMNLQLLPVVGLWLPFMSYGGSAMWLCMASVGLVLNISARQKPVLF